MAGRKLKVIEHNKKNFTKEEKERRKAIEDKASDGFSPLQKTAPRHLNPLARYEYERVVKDLETLPVKNMDRVTLELYCTWYSVYREAEKDIHEYGIFSHWEITEERRDAITDQLSIETVIETDTTKKNPAISIMNEASANIIRCASNLGLTVDSRMRIYAPPQEEKKKSIFEKFGG
ncbi:phage terminase small subunit P27 family [Enterococcus rotai]|uniref:phage terminase small subunit P27 family n=1 Tax=Enterococcus rotai TaxID=118060 RepID=UPI0035C76E32